LLPNWNMDVLLLDVSKCWIFSLNRS
jgi:hypothetical protein